MTETNATPPAQRWRAGFVLDLDAPGEFGYMTTMEHQVWASSAADVMDLLADHLDAFADVEREREELDRRDQPPTEGSITLTNIHDWRDGPSGDGSVDLASASLAAQAAGHQLRGNLGASATMHVFDEWQTAGPARCESKAILRPGIAQQKRCIRWAGHPQSDDINRAEPHVWLESLSTASDTAMLALWNTGDEYATLHPVHKAGEPTVSASAAEELKDRLKSAYDQNRKHMGTIKELEGQLDVATQQTRSLTSTVDNLRGRLSKAEDETTLATLNGTAGWLQLPGLRRCQKDGQLLMNSHQNTDVEPCTCGRTYWEAAPLYVRRDA